MRLVLVMVRCQIKVIKKTYHKDLAETYCAIKTGLCSEFEEGQTFVTESPTRPPKEFPCGWAWSDIQKIVLTMMQGGNFGSKFGNWMKNDETMIVCCSDGIRPVIFELKVIDL